MIELILIEPRKQENLGAIARAMKNFGFENLVLISPKCKIGITAYKVAKHAKDVLKNSKIKYVSYLSKFDYLVGTTSKIGTDYNMPRSPIEPEQLAEKISKIDFKKLKIGVLIGREGNGLNNEEINLCDIIVTIPASNEYPIMNVSHAVSIILYEMFKKINDIMSNSHITFATQKEKEIIMDYINGILDKMDFSTAEKKETQRKLWKRVFGKATLTKREAFAVMGFLRKLLRK